MLPTLVAEGPGAPEEEQPYQKAPPVMTVCQEEEALLAAKMVLAKRRREAQVKVDEQAKRIRLERCPWMFDRSTEKPFIRDTKQQKIDKFFTREPSKVSSSHEKVKVEVGEEGQV